MKIVRFVVALALIALGLGAVATPALAYPAGQLATAQINSTVFTPGSSVVVTVQNTTPGPLTMLIFSAPVVIGTGTVGPNFQGSVSGIIPAGYSGQHTISVNGAGGEVFNFPVTVTSTPGTVRVADTRVVLNCQGLTLDAAVDVEVDGSPITIEVEIDGEGGNVQSDDIFTFSGTQTFQLNSVPITATQQSILVRAQNPNQSGGSDFYASATVTFASCSGGTSTPPTSTPTTTPSGSTAPTTAPGTGTGGAGGAGGNGGALASTGAQVGLGAGLGVAALVGGGALLLATRRRSTPRHGG